MAHSTTKCHTTTKKKKHPTDLLQDPQHHRNNQTMIISRLLKLDTACISVSKVYWKLMNHPFNPARLRQKHQEQNPVSTQSSSCSTGPNEFPMAFFFPL